MSSAPQNRRHPTTRWPSRGQHGLDADALIREVRLQRVAEAEDIGLRGVVDAIEHLDCHADTGRDVDDGLRSAGHEGRSDGVGQAGQRGDIDLDHCVHVDLDAVMDLGEADAQLGGDEPCSRAVSV